MAFIGNQKGPRESDLLRSLGHEYFGCTPAGLEDDISYAEFSEQRGEVAPVHVDQSGRAYVEYSSPVPTKPQRFYLEAHELELVGDISTFTEDEQMRWVVRSLVGGERAPSI